MDCFKSTFPLIRNRHSQIKNRKLPMSYERLIIDGYSLIHRDPELKKIVRQNLQRSREQLIDQVSRTATALAKHIIIVFDGQGHNGPGHINTSAVEVIYSKAGQTADTVIERLVHQATNPTAWMVVTNDRLERETVMATGAHSMSCAVFIEECLLTQKQHKQSIQRNKLKTPCLKLGEFFPDKE